MVIGKKTVNSPEAETSGRMEGIFKYFFAFIHTLHDFKTCAKERRALLSVNIKTTQQGELFDITSHIQSAVKESGVGDGTCFIYCPHTTAGLTINENADPSVKDDILRGLDGMIPSINFSHMEGNSPAHIKASMMGFSLQVLDLFAIKNYHKQA